MHLEVIEGYPEFRGKLIRLFAKCIGLKFEHIIFVNVIDEENE